MLVERIIKIIIVGDSGTGKTSLIKKYINKNESIIMPEITIGIDFQSKLISLDGLPTKVHFWDTAGQDHFRSIINYYYKDTCAAIIVFDITNFDSFANVKFWLEEVKKNNNCPSDHKHPILLLGNKTDLKSKRNVNADMVEALIIEHGLLYAEVSAKEESDLETPINLLYGAIYQNLSNSSKKKCYGVRECVKFPEYQEQLKLDMPHRRWWWCSCCPIL
jgi:small GTP-binding protein